MINIVSGVVTSIFDLFTSTVFSLSAFSSDLDSWILFSSSVVSSLTGLI